METLTKNDDQLIENNSTFSAKMQRRSFLRYAGAGAATVGVLAACKRHHDEIPDPSAIDVGSGDVGILNFAYALEQLEAAFYTQVVAMGSFSTLFSAQEQIYLTDIRDHEIAHREFFKTAITAAAPSGIIPALTPDFSSIDFNTRLGILSAAKAFEDTGVSAYNGAGSSISSAAYLTIAGKIVSVEARHAALIRDLISYGSYADSTNLDSNALDKQLTAGAVVVIANGYLKTKISANSLPK
ncbi:ferritin-like domain-containing protein [Mucilaginibacter paludis]|uniref:Ferritin-like domain-containing protein n=1 Tax=Mucilaginibacter paludis DSM 18603 TaxID=714943 RepID=H1Y052_9SPHI|nr:ferritin-like domain-containing protein [Mucilaginibacter paludis]EHQ27961.1 hypothetical protein Mucpa_3869 [Mucilaginibacter paludis DSM 18603]